MITTAYAQLEYTGNGVTTAFAVSWPYFETSDLIVNLRDSVTGVDVLQVLGTDYTATTPTTAPGTGTVTFLTAPASGKKIIIQRALPLTQELDYVEDDSFPSSSHEEGLDRAVMHAQERKADLLRAIKFISTDPAASVGDLPNSVTRASKYLGFDANGKPVALDTPAGTTALSVWGSAWGVLADAAAGRAELVVMKVDAGTEAAKPAANVFGEGIWYSTDIHRAFYSNATTWVELGLEQFDAASEPASAVNGRVILNTDRNDLKRDTGAGYVPIRSLPPGYMMGFISWSANGSPRFGAGEGNCRDLADTVDMSLGSSGMSKAFTAPWVEGDTNGGRPSAVGIAVGKWYRIFAIAKDDGTTDLGLDDSASAANLMADAAVVAAGYKYYRRVGWCKSDASVATNLVPHHGLGAGVRTSGLFGQAGGWNTWTDGAQTRYVTALDFSVAGAGANMVFLEAPPETLAYGWIYLANSTGDIMLYLQDTDGPAAAPPWPSPTATPGRAVAATGGSSWWMGFVSSAGYVKRPFANDVSADVAFHVLGWQDVGFE